MISGEKNQGKSKEQCGRKDNKMRRDKAQKTTHLDYIYTYKVQEQAKLIYGNKNKNSGHLW